MDRIDSKTNPTRPAFQYHGGKWRTAPWIISHFPEHTIYVEPFGGAASVLIQKDRSQVEVYNDLDDQIVNVFRVIRSRCELLKRQLDCTPYSRAEFQRCYSPGGNDVERARKTIVKSFMGFGGNGVHRRTGFRSFHKKRCGPEKAWHTYPQQLDLIKERFKGVVIENRPAIEVMQRNDSAQTLHYVDPPYLPSTRDAGTDYTHELTTNDHVELAAVLHALKGSVILSGYPDPLYDRLFKRWKTHERKTRCASSAERTEKIWIKTASK